MNMMKDLYNLAAKGINPLFESNWLKESLKSPQEENKIDAKHFQIICENLAKLNTLHKKQTYILSLKKEDRAMFINTFFRFVEASLLNTKPELH